MTRSVRLAVVAIAAVGALLGWMASSAGASGTGSELHVAARWEMDERRGATVMGDSSDRGVLGIIGSTVQAGVPSPGSTGFRFPRVDHDAAAKNPRRLVVVGDDHALDPGSGDHQIELRIRPTAPDGNIVQKGQWHTPGGYFKVDMDDGRVWCTYKGSAGVVTVRSPSRIDDGGWTAIRCSRSGDLVSMALDGAVVDRRRGPTGTISNRAMLTVGGKEVCDRTSSGCDYYSGDVDRLTIRSSGAAPVK